MRIALALAAAILIGAAPPSRPPFTLPADLAGKTVLYVGAHPDDEWGMAPILAEACLEKRARCRFVVATGGPSHGCLLTIGLRDPVRCSELRREEMRAAAGYFGGQVEFFGFEDLFYSFDESGKDRVIADWGKPVGGRKALVGMFEAVLRRERPALVFGFDPRHGSSCHAGHRATAELLVEAVLRLAPEDRPQLWLEQTDDIDDRPGIAADRKAIITATGFAAWPDTAAAARWYDATRRLPDGKTGYDHAVIERRFHATQVPDEAAGKRVPNPPPTARQVPVTALTADWRGDYCTALKLDRPTLDIAANRKRFGIE